MVHYYTLWRRHPTPILWPGKSHRRLLLFVGIPLPGTGAWTGTLAASLLDMDFKSSVVAVMLGVILAGVIMGLLSMGIFGTIFAL